MQSCVENHTFAKFRPVVKRTARVSGFFVIFCFLKNGGKCEKGIHEFVAHSDIKPFVPVN